MTKPLPRAVTLLRVLKLAIAASLVCGTGVLAGAAGRDIDREKSTVTVRVSKAGVFRAFGDNHEVRAPVKSGSVDDGAQASVRVVINAAQMRVVDPGLSPHDREEVQTRMLGPDVLDVTQFPEIRFESTAVHGSQSDRLSIDGRLTLHGQTQPVVVSVAHEHDHYRGTATVKQSAFGIKPVAAAGGTVKVKDEVTIEFDIAILPTKSGL